VRLLYVTSEVHPFSKTGGLADVAGALPVALSKLGVQAMVISPWYVTLNGSPELVGTLEVMVAGVPYSVRVGQLERDGVRYVFLGSSSFARDQPYGYPDDVERFVRFSKAVPAALDLLGFVPGVVHLNDWQTGLIAPMLRLANVGLPSVSGLDLRAVRIVYTIHNLQYQGRWNPREVLEWSGLPQSTVGLDGLEFFGDANLAKAGINYSDVVTTVSPRYAQEVQTAEFGCGLEGVLWKKGVTGILNGIDTGYWNPATDSHLTARYSDLAGKTAARDALVRELGLDRHKPILAMVTRLADQKGLDLLLETLPAVIQDWTLVVLGSGERTYMSVLEAMCSLNSARVAFGGRFDEALAHRIYAGADAFLMPSQFEPCGLSQLIGMRYGTVPIVRRTGGLADTVPESRGYGFEPYTLKALTETLARARAEFATPAWMQRAVQGMAGEYGWDRAAMAHLELYNSQ
jgi:starch synthase